MARHKIVVHNIPFPGQWERIPIIVGSQDRFSVVLRGSERHALTIDGLLSVVPIDDIHFDMVLDCCAPYMHSVIKLLPEDIKTRFRSHADEPVVTHHLSLSETIRIDAAICQAVNIVIAVALSDMGLSFDMGVADTDILLIMPPSNFIQSILTAESKMNAQSFCGAQDGLSLRMDNSKTYVTSFANSGDKLQFDGEALLTFPIDFGSEEFAALGMAIVPAVPEVIVYRVYFLYDWAEYSLSDLSEMTLSTMNRSEVIE